MEKSGVDASNHVVLEQVVAKTSRCQSKSAPKSSRKPKNKGGRPTHTQAQHEAAYVAKKQRQRDKRTAASHQRIQAHVQAEVAAARLESHIAGCTCAPCIVHNSVLPWWAVAPDGMQPATHAELHGRPFCHEVSASHVIGGWVAPAACITPSACSHSETEVATYCDACWSAWEASLQEHSNVAKFRDAELEVRLGLVALVALVALMWRLWRWCCGACGLSACVAHMTLALPLHAYVHILSRCIGEFRST